MINLFKYAVPVIAVLCLSSCGNDEPELKDDGDTDVENSAPTDTTSDPSTSDNEENLTLKDFEITWNSTFSSSLHLVTYSKSTPPYAEYAYLYIDNDGFLRFHNIGISQKSWAEIRDMGPVNSITDMKDIPSDGWQSKVKAVEGHGYIVHYPGYNGKIEELGRTEVREDYFGEKITGYWYARLVIGKTYQTRIGGYDFTMTHATYQERWAAPSLFKCPKFRNEEIQVRVYHKRNVLNQYIVVYEPSFIPFEHAVDYSIPKQLDHLTKGETRHHVSTTGLHLASDKIPSVSSETITVSTDDGSNSILIHYGNMYSTPEIIK